jgi:hypothetical protein
MNKPVLAANTWLSGHENQDVSSQQCGPGAGGGCMRRNGVDKKLAIFFGLGQKQN